ncbi:DUF5694 domain-containing protein [uncultured Kordia sp.]|uniref:DUF5694 domain-containing protein n=1 Tax=uncultured Kordia sp. TaxID=507699 RepID=UPI00262FB736|nr:DUF5694 domain-containing protein [uncultured Kordia sp.]
MKNILRTMLLFGLLSSCTTPSEKPLQQQEGTKKIKVYLLGTFHFTQTDSTYNVLDDKHQKSIQDLCDLIVLQKPNKVFIERQPEFEFKNKYDSLFTNYVQTDVLKGKNEMYQVGFRVAKTLKHPKVYQCDNPGQFGHYYRKALAYAKENNQMQFVNATGKGTVIREDDQVNEDSLMHNSSLLKYIQWINSDAVMRTSHASYVANDVLIGSKDYYNYDDDDTLIGAQITADWYRRNIMIYTKMVNQLSYNEDAIFLIIGADHVPIIKHLFNSNPHFKVIETTKWLNK